MTFICFVFSQINRRNRENTQKNIEMILAVSGKSIRFE